MILPIKISRKNFLKSILWLLAIPVTFIWLKMVQTHQKITPAKKSVLLPLDFPPGISFQGNLIINNQSERLTVFSAQCTHLGCIINHQKDNQVTCPCHGSAFSSTGTPIKGPARTSLKKLDYTYDKTRKSILVHLT